ncbi:Histidine phosphatase superfamily (branch 2) [Vibrio aerogenes CECT 7868]|uniref:Multiple inositol polyphosphate phosphatase 1 n=1 Tax=Vibrio aerogenes CECT 7868 TaxID=1216006 RepID=A0A1M6BI27_9VIBR|nr:histidine-type phosphatase [Vibrio aerogenes]SHI48369.1 Histidine phosphatase superfamily (branch 2) [Vibrio aerogenes CECT 7868]
MKIYISVFGAMMLAGCSLPGNSPASADYVYGTKTVYSPRQAMNTYEPVPDGYSLVFTQSLARHGSRALTSPKYDDISLKIWQKAKDLHALTPAGEKLGAEISRLMTANEKLGYGELSRLGHREHRGIGMRMVQRDKPLFVHATKQGRKILVEYSGRSRAKESAVSFVHGLIQADPALEPLIMQPQINRNQLYFHKQNKAYQQYKKHNKPLHLAVERLFDQPETHQIARRILERIYTPAFVDALAEGKYQFTRRGKKKAQVYTETDAAMQLFNLYLISPGMVDESNHQPWQFNLYFTPEETQWLTYLSDGKNFYQKGPGLNQTDITYRIAKGLEDDFFHQVKAVQNGTNPYAAKLRFAHAETIIPFAAQMQLKGSTQSVSLSEGYQPDNPWHGAWVSPYSANIQWDVFRNAADGKLLVKMLYNEKETAFKQDCKPVKPGSYYYSFDTLLHCYHQM